MNGKAAMFLGRPRDISQFKHEKNFEGKGKDFDWGMVTVPINPASPNESADLELEEFFAITKDTPNLSIAWEFVKFNNSPENAKSKSKSIGYRVVPTRNQFLKEIDGKSTEAIYQLKPKVNERINDNIPSEFREPYSKLLNETLKAIIDNKKTVNETVTELEKKGQEALVEGGIRSTNTSH